MRDSVRDEPQQKERGCGRDNYCTYIFMASPFSVKETDTREFFAGILF